MSIILSDIEGAIFDMDGTLLDSMYAWNNVAKDYVLSLGFEPEADFNEKFLNYSLKQTVDYFREKYGLTLSEAEILGGLNKHVEHYYFDEVVTKDGVKELLEILKQNGTKMCVATATDKYLAEAALKRNGISEYFSRIFTCNEVGAGKSKPKIYDVSRDFLKTDIEHTYVFEDAFHAIITAEKAGYKVIGIKDSFQKADINDISAHCEVFVNSPAELLKLL